MSAMVSYSDAAISPDGSSVAYVLSSNDLEHNRSIDRLHLFDLKTHHDVTLALPQDSFDNLLWSSQGRLLVVTHDAATDADQAFVIGTDGAETRITHGSSDVLDAAWSPDGTRIAFLRRDQAPKPTGAGAFEDAFEVGDNDYLATHAARDAHLWVADVASGSEYRITHGDWSILDDLPSWSADGRFVAYAHAENAVHGDDDRSYIERADVASGARRALTGQRRYEETPNYGAAASAVAFLYPRDGDPSNESELYLLTPRGTRDVSRALDRYVEGYGWFDAAHVLLRVNDRTRVRLVVASLDGRTFRDLPTGEVADASLGDQAVSRAGAVVFTGSTPSHPSELYYLAAGAARPQRLTDGNAAVAALDLGRETEISYRNGGFTQYAVLTYPPHYDARRRYPLVLRIHGGPNLFSAVAFDPFYQLAAARGYVVLAPNYRGSTDFGNEFERAIFNDASAGPGTDVMAAIDAVRAMGIVDPDRIGVSGWSYGGQLTSWMIGHYSIFKAAVAGAAVNDLVVDYAIADDLDDDRQAFSAGPWTGGLAQWRAASPISYVTRISTPTLFLSNVYDVRVPIVENYELFRALRDRGVPVKFYAWPATGHLPHGPVRYAQAYRLWLDWFDRYLRAGRS